MKINPIKAGLIGGNHPHASQAPQTIPGTRNRAAEIRMEEVIYPTEKINLLSFNFLKK